jgi:hypothetical protein
MIHWLKRGVKTLREHRLVILLFLPMLTLGVMGVFGLRHLVAAPGDGHMLLFYDGATIPSGWTCVSCSPGDPFYQRFVRFSDSYGTNGGSAVHNHTYSQSLSSSNTAAATENFGSGDVDANSHSHILTSSLNQESNLPAYRQLQIIRSDINGEPSVVPAGAIAIFDSTSLPSNWTRYSAQDGRYIRGENTISTTGGSNTHAHTVTTTIGAATGATFGSRGGGTQVSGAATGHSHTASGSSSTENNEPPYIEAVLAIADIDVAPPANMLAMWDAEIPNGWQMRSNINDPFYQRFLKPVNSFGTTGGSESHSHGTTVITSSAANISVNARSGPAGASANHAHTVTISGYSTETHLPPFAEVMIAKKSEPSDLLLSSYRWFRNSNSSDVGLALAAQDTPATSQGLPFRLRLTISVDTQQLSQSGESLRLQYAQRSGTCDIGFSGESYADVSATSGPIRFYDNASPTSGDPVVANLNDPAPTSGTASLQTYNEQNPFSNNESAISIGDYGVWDFALFDHSAPSDTSYCFRAVYSDGSLLSGYDHIPELMTDDGQGNMVLLYDGVTVPSQWTCVSCNPGEPYYQRFARGAATYGATGGSETHSHTASGSVAATTDSGGNTGAGTQVSALSHSHTVTPELADANHLPPYRQLKYIRYDLSGSPANLPNGVIALFDTNVPAGWTRYGAQDGFYVRGENAVGSTGGSLTHTHNLSGLLSDAAGGTTTDGGGGPTGTGATPGHSHTLSGTSPAANHEPPYRNTILGQINAAGSLPAGMIAFWDGTPPGSWDVLSDTGGDFHQRFVKGAVTYGGSGGSASHIHSNHAVTTSTPSGSIAARSSGGGASAAHTHNVSITAVSDENNLPPYIDTVIAKQPIPNDPPNNPTNLDQFRVTLGTQISLGGYNNETSIEFRATADDPDNPDELQLCVEAQPLSQSFSDIEQDCGDLVAYSGTAVQLSVVIPGLADTQSYHWQARTKDNSGAYSGWVSYGGNAENERDFAIDTVAPSGTVYDGTIGGIDVEFNDGSLNTLSANWVVDSGFSGLDGYEYSIGTTPGATDVLGWQPAGIDTDFTETGLSLKTSQQYHANVRATDNAGNQTVISSNGQIVAPSLEFSVSNGDILFSSPSSANGYTVTETAQLDVSTNAYNGYEVRAYATGLLADQLLNTVPLFDGGTYLAPAEWLPVNRGFGYTSNDNFVVGLNRFTNNPCPGGGSPPCFAPYSVSAPGDIVADNDGPITDTPIQNELFNITHRVTIDPDQPSGLYNTTLIFSAKARY